MSDVDTPINLSPDQKAVALREIVNMLDALQGLHGRIKKDSLDGEMREVLISLAEHGVASIGKTLGFETESQQKIEARYAEIRAANMRIYELERQQGRAGDMDTLPRKLRLLTDKLRNWWRKDGLGYVSSVQYTEGGNCIAELSCRLSGDFRLTGSNTPVSDEERRTDWLESLKAAGFDVVREGHYDANIVDSDAGRRLLMDMVLDRFPSARITEFTNHFLQRDFSRQEGKFFLRIAKIMIHNLAEIDALPEPQAQI